MKKALLVFVLASSAFAQQKPFTAPKVAAKFAGIHSSSAYVSMKDGTRIAVDILLPAKLPASQKLPTLLHITRYGRAAVDGSIASYDKFWVAHGYARVLMDERGTGASFGTVRYGKATLGDIKEIVDWIVSQPWSNGRVGATGVSYDGTTSELLAATQHPAVRAVAPFFSDYNYYTDLVRPGGVFNEWLMKTWQTETSQMDAGQTAKRVDSDTDGTLLKEAIREHAGSIDVYRATLNAEFIDDPTPAFGGSMWDASVVALRDEIERSRVPILIFASWFDAGTVQGTLQRFQTVSNSQRVFIGAWNHGGRRNADPFFPKRTQANSSESQQWEALEFFEHYLNTSSTAEAPFHRLNYYTIGEGVWHSTDVWPPAGLRPTIYWLQPQGGLVRSPAQREADFEVPLKVTATGELNRWHSQLTAEEINYADVLPAMQRLTAFTSEPLSAALEITGQPVLRMHLKCSELDPSVIAYLLAIDPHGKALYLTEGELRLVDRRLALAEQTLHTYARKDAEPVSANTEMEADFTLLPISALIPKGYRLRLLLAAGDSSTFSTSPEYRATISKLQIELPARQREKIGKSQP